MVNKQDDLNSPIITSYGFSDIGPIRPNNEDVWAAFDEHSFFTIADGMGGHNAGEIAAKEATDHLCNEAIPLLSISLDKILNRQQIITHLRKSIQYANARVYELGKHHETLKGMGTTLCCLYFYGNEAIYAHVGDSRIYCYRKNQLRQLTQDHSLINKIINQEKQGENDKVIITPSYKNIITKAIGTSLFIEPEISIIDLHPGDTFFLCTDGFSDYVSQLEMLQILKTERSLKNRVHKMINTAKEKNSNDNITVLMVEVKDNL